MLTARAAAAALITGLAAAPAAAAKPSLLPEPTGARAGSVIALKASGFDGAPKFRFSRDGEGGRELQARQRKGRWRVTIPRSAPFGPHFVTGCAKGRCSTTPIAVIARARPLRVDPQLDEFATTATIDREGGELFAFGNDGTAYTLTIPENAVAEPVEITMTPLTGLEGAPLSGGFAAGVQLEPSGLRLFRSGTLQIAPGGEVARGRLSAVGWSGAGGNFHFVPFTEDALTIPVGHFSGYGAGTANASDRRTAGRRPPSTAEQQAEAAAAAAKRAARTTDEYTDALKGILDTLFYADVLPRLENAENDDRRIADAIRSALAWLREVKIAFPGDYLDLFGGTEFPRERDYLERQLPHLYTVAKNRTLIRCATEKDPVHISRYLVWEREASLLEGRPGNPSQIEAALAPCGQFELDVEAAYTDMGVSSVTSGSNTVDAFLDATAGVQSLELEANTGWLTEGSSGAVAPAFKSLDWTAPGCTATVQAQPGSAPFAAWLTPHRAQLDHDFEKVADAPGVLTLSPGNPEEHVEYTCPDPGGGTSPGEETHTAWAGHWIYASHLNARSTSVTPAGQQSYLFDVALAGGGQAFARTWNVQPEGKSSTNPEFDGTIAVAIRHTPDPALADGPTGVREGKRRDKWEQRILQLLRGYAKRRRAAAGP